MYMDPAPCYRDECPPRGIRVHGQASYSFTTLLFHAGVDARRCGYLASIGRGHAPVYPGLAFTVGRLHAQDRRGSPRPAAFNIVLQHEFAGQGTVAQRNRNSSKRKPAHGSDGSGGRAGQHGGVLSVLSVS
jgi:hypothetical protein